MIGHEAAEQALLDGYRSGRIHHAWLLHGPAGIGKASLAFRFARFLLSHPDPAENAVKQARNLDVPPGSPITRQIASRGHPNLIVLERPRDEEGKTTSAVIPVEGARKVGGFLGTTAANGNWRIVIVDAADDLNRASANALLKLLEEPPARALFLLVSHVPGRLLPTIRSRCRGLALQPLSDRDMVRALDLVAGPGAIEAGEEDRQTAVRLARGSVGQALAFLSVEGRETLRDVLRHLESLPHNDDMKMRAVAERLGRRGGEADYRLATQLLLDWIAERARASARAGTPPAQLAPWSEVWEKICRALAETETYNLDRTQTLLMAFRAVSAAAVQDAARV